MQTALLTFFTTRGTPKKPRRVDKHSNRRAPPPASEVPLTQGQPVAAPRAHAHAAQGKPRASDADGEAVVASVNSDPW